MARMEQVNRIFRQLNKRINFAIGKSNYADAISFALGAQGRTLRVRKIEVCLAG